MGVEMRFRSRVVFTSLAAGLSCLALAPRASAEPFTINAVLTGDARANNPDNIFVNVTIAGDTTSNLASWVVDINSPLHPNATLDVFAFNLALGAGQSVNFSNFSPSSWSVTGPADNVQGSGGADFLFESSDPPGASNNVTNSVNLTFSATLLGAGTWSTLNFLNAPLSDGGGIPDPGAQLGAHVRSLSTAGCTGCSDSGFASGVFQPPTSSVPEPATLLLYGVGLLAAAATRRKR
jgi:PEP-CTERM motif